MPEWRLLLHDALVQLLRLERRLEPRVRPWWNHHFRDLSAFALQLALSAERPRQRGLGLAEERWVPEEEAWIEQVLAAWDTGATSPRASKHAWHGVEKIHGLVRAELEIRGDLPAPLRRGLFAQPRKYRAWVSFTGLVPKSMADLDGPGLLGVNVKVLGVPGPKLAEDERLSQDFVARSAPTLPVKDARDLAELLRCAQQGTPLFYFARRRLSRLRELLMQALWSETHASPFTCTYYGPLPIALGQDQAALYALHPRPLPRTHIRGSAVFRLAGLSAREHGADAGPARGGARAVAAVAKGPPPHAARRRARALA